MVWWHHPGWFWRRWAWHRWGPSWHWRWSLEDELLALEDYKSFLEKELEAVNARIKEIRSLLKKKGMEEV
jgi:hypothetical protein